MIAAAGRIDGAAAVGFAADSRLHGGALSGADGAVIGHAYRTAVARRIPVVGLWQCAGVRLAEGRAACTALARCSPR